MNKYWRMLLTKNNAGIILLFLLCQTINATECYVKTGKVTVTKEGKETTYIPGDRINPCKGKSKKATICYKNKFEQEICKETSGDIEPKDLARVRSPSPLLQLIISLYKPEKVEFYGGKRLKESEYLAGFPYGEVLLPERTLAFSTNNALQVTMKKFELYEKEGNKKLLFRTHQVEKKIVIPVAHLRLGAKYKWLLLSKNKKYTGVFTTTQQQDQQEFEKELKEILFKSDRSVSTRHLLRAVLAKEYGFTFDMQQSIEAARNAIKKGS